MGSSFDPAESDSDAKALSVVVSVITDCVSDGGATTLISEEPSGSPSVAFPEKPADDSNGRLTEVLFEHPLIRQPLIIDKIKTLVNALFIKTPKFKTSLKSL